MHTTHRFAQPNTEIRMLLIVLFAVLRTWAVGRHGNSSDMTWCACIVDTRFDDLVVASLANARYHIPLHVPIYVVTARANWNAARATLATFRNIYLVTRYDYSVPTAAAYNRLLMSYDFWQNFTEAYILIIQRDSRFCTGSRQRITDYIGRYDYIGAPWLQPFGGTFVGNGGFSLRSRAAMLACTASTYRGLIRSVNEDGALAVCVRDLGMRLASLDAAAMFSVEQVHIRGALPPLAIHGAWRYINNDTYLARYCPEFVRV